MTIKYSRFGRLLSTMAVTAVVLAGCANTTAGEDDQSGQADSTSVPRGVVGDQGDPGTPTKGGTLSFASYSPVTNLDPAKTQGAGPTGGTEMAAVYDVLMRYDADSQTFVPQIAQSLEESADRSTWTLTLRPDVRFSDGAPFDADAVVASIERYNDNRGLYSQLFTEIVQSVTAKDSSNVEFKLNRAWSDFPAILCYGHGMIVAPSAQQGDTFTPIGAGPFSVVKLLPQQELELKARPDYWGGEPNLDGLKFVAVAGEQAKIETLRTGGVQAIYLRNAATVNAAKEEFPGFIEAHSQAMIGQINQAPGRPGADRRVRQAMAYALDPTVLNQRARDGQGMPGTDLFQPWSQWHGAETGVTPEAARAEQLVDQAKKDGFDGKVTYVSINDPDAQKLALAIQAQLNSVGFDTSIEYTNSAPDMIRRVYVDRDFDLAHGAYNASDIDPEIRMFNAMHSKANNLVGLADPKADSLLAALLSAPDAETKKQAINDIQTYVNEEQPFLAWGASNTYVAWSPNVFRMNPSIDHIMLFDKAFIRD
ncbi:ABC transporter substrate-binding protein [Rhodococcus rhodochrous]|uniref:ABC transporter substrate-binding protein n=1 Tax=Rhodococcus rhodochrous TaxID=1829 RepID=UPI00301E0675